MTGGLQVTVNLEKIVKITGYEPNDVGWCQREAEEA